jgi:UDP-N-acetylglucosamine transferase subunit ALG13
VIFVTIGSMFPFDRLIRAMDAWAAARPEAAGGMLAQIGEGAYRPAHMRWVTRLGIAEYEATVAQAQLVVAHAGVGSVVTAGEHGRPIVVLPRRAHLGEHTSDHQMQTAGWLRGKPGVHVAETEAELAGCIDRALAEDPEAAGRLARSADPIFIARLRDFLTT